MGKVNQDLIEYNGISSCIYGDISYFKQFSVEHVFCIPKEKPNIEQIIKVWGEACILDKEIINTPVGTSVEGQSITGYKLLVCGDISLKIEYVACEPTQSVHTAHSKFPFCGYIVLPKDTNLNAIIKATVSIEDIFSEQMDLRCIYNNITMIIVADIC